MHPPCIGAGRPTHPPRTRPRSASVAATRVARVRSPAPDASSPCWLEASSARRPQSVLAAACQQPQHHRASCSSAPCCCASRGSADALTCRKHVPRCRRARGRRRIAGRQRAARPAAGAKLLAADAKPQHRRQR
eukprot:scaffold122515_cov54-Phaeocystis_antarctica.AAC.2